MGKCTAIIPAAGQGKRMKALENKQFLSLQGMPVIVHTLQVFECCPAVDEIILVVAAGEEDGFRALVDRYGFSKVRDFAIGGRERQDSVCNGLARVDEESDTVLVHDGARPLVSCAIIEEAIIAARENGAAVVAVPVKDTIKEAADGYVTKTLDRQYLWQAQTPQSFQYGILLEALEKAQIEGFMGTDDTSLAERLGIPVKVVFGSYDNLKITTPEDLILAEAILNRRKGQ